MPTKEEIVQELYSRMDSLPADKQDIVRELAGRLGIGAVEQPKLPPMPSHVPQELLPDSMRDFRSQLPHLGVDPLGKGAFMQNPMVQGAMHMLQPGWDAKAGGASQVLRGAGEALAPLALPGLIAAPAATLAAAAGGAGGGALANLALKGLDAPEGLQDLGTDAGAVLGGGMASRIPSALADIPLVGQMAKWGARHFLPPPINHIAAGMNVPNINGELPIPALPWNRIPPAEYAPESVVSSGVHVNPKAIPPVSQSPGESVSSGQFANPAASAPAPVQKPVPNIEPVTGAIPGGAFNPRGQSSLSPHDASITQKATNGFNHMQRIGMSPAQYDALPLDQKQAFWKAAHPTGRSRAPEGASEDTVNRMKEMHRTQQPAQPQQAQHAPAPTVFSKPAHDLLSALQRAEPEADVPVSAQRIMQSLPGYSKQAIEQAAQELAAKRAILGHVSDWSHSPTPELINSTLESGRPHTPGTTARWVALSRRTD